MKLHRNSLRFCLLLGSAFAFFTLNGCTQKKESGPSLQVLTYSSLGSQGGFLDSVKGDFLAKSGCTLKVETTLGAAQILSYLDEEKQRKRIDLVMGIDQLLFERAKASFYQGGFPSLKIEERLIPILKGRSAPGFIPLDYGALSFIYRKADFKGAIKVPTELSDLLKTELRRKWIVQDPRASSPGMLFFLFTDRILKISDLKKQWVTLAPSWDSSYKMFLAKDAPMVWSYLTSLAYHASKGERDLYDYVDFKEGLPVQIEGMAALNHVGDPLKDNPCLEKWLEYILSPERQTLLVQKQWMMPAMANVTLPALFNTVPSVKKVAPISLELEKVDSLVSHFGKEVQGDSL